MQFQHPKLGLYLEAVLWTSLRKIIPDGFGDICGFGEFSGFGSGL